MMKVSLLALAAMSLLLGVGVHAKVSPIDTGDYDSFVSQLAVCYSIIDPVEIHTPIASGAFGMYYFEPTDSPFDAPTALHDFGWYLSGPMACRSLIRLVEGRHFDCQRQPLPGDPVSLMPQQTGQFLRLAHQDDVEIGFWLNREYNPVDESVSDYGLYFTETSFNMDEQQHAFVYQADYKKTTPVVDGCGYFACTSGYVELPATGKVILIFWEDACDWDTTGSSFDFMVALFVYP